MGRAHQRDAILLSAKSGVPHILRAAALAALAMLTCAGTMHAAHAADMAMPQPFEPQQDDERVLFGTGWYIRGDLGVAQDAKLAVGSLSLPANSRFPNSYSFGLGAGYRYNNWIRTDVTADVRKNRSYEGNTAAGIKCQTGAAPVTTAGVVTGSTPVYANCFDYSRARVSAYHVLFNTYVDLGTWAGVTPYVGAGVGFSVLYQKASQNWFMGNAVAYNPTWTDPFTNGTYSAYWDQSRSTRSISLHGRRWRASLMRSIPMSRSIWAIAT